MAGDLATRLAEARQLAKLTQRDAAKAAGISAPYWNQLERGLKSPSLDVLDALADAVGVDVAWLLGSGEPQPNIPLDGEVEADGTVAAEHLAEILHPGAFRAAREAFSYPDRFPIPGAKPGMWITKALVDMPRADIKAGDQLVCDPDLEPKLGDIVIATNDTDQYHEEYSADLEPPLTKLKLYRQVDDEIWLWPLVDDDRPDQWEPWWRVVAVIVGVWRPLR